jgi:hypothetical protein
LWRRAGELSVTPAAETRAVLPKSRAMKEEACILIVEKRFVRRGIVGAEVLRLECGGIELGGIGVDDLLNIVVGSYLIYVFPSSEHGNVLLLGVLNVDILRPRMMLGIKGGNLRRRTCICVDRF